MSFVSSHNLSDESSCSLSVAFLQTGLLTRSLSSECSVTSPSTAPSLEGSRPKVSFVSFLHQALTWFNKENHIISVIQKVLDNRENLNPTCETLMLLIISHAIVSEDLASCEKPYKGSKFVYDMTDVPGLETYRRKMAAPSVLRMANNLFTCGLPGSQVKYGGDFLTSEMVEYYFIQLQNQKLMTVSSQDVMECKENLKTLSFFIELSQKLQSACLELLTQYSARTIVRLFNKFDESPKRDFLIFCFRQNPDILLRLVTEPFIEDELDNTFSYEEHFTTYLYHVLMFLKPNCNLILVDSRNASVKHSILKQKLHDLTNCCIVSFKTRASSQLPGLCLPVIEGNESDDSIICKIYKLLHKFFKCMILTNDCSTLRECNQVTREFFKYADIVADGGFGDRSLNTMTFETFVKQFTDEEHTPASSASASPPPQHASPPPQHASPPPQHASPPPQHASPISKPQHAVVLNCGSGSVTASQPRRNAVVLEHGSCNGGAASPSGHSVNAGRASQSKTCFNCGQPGHIKCECPSKKVTVNVLLVSDADTLSAAGTPNRVTQMLSSICKAGSLPPLPKATERK